MPRGASPKREREYEEIVRKSKEEGRYKGREEEVAARIVNKQRSEAGETRSARSRKSSSSSSSRRKPARSSRKSQGTRRVKQSSSARSARKSASRKPTSSSRKSASTRRSTSRSRAGRKASSSKLTHYTTDHDEIRSWAESRGGKPSHVVRTARGKRDAGILRLDFPGYSGEGSLEAISWDDWFEKFDQSKLALAYQDRTSRGQKSNFNKLVGRDSVPLH